MASTGSSTSGTTTTGSEIISSVNQSGSGINLKSLVTGLVNAETSVAQSQITKKVENTNLAISAFGTLTSKLDTLNTDLTTLKSNTARSVASSNTAVILSVTDETIANDVYSEIEVSALAAGQVTTFDLTHASLLNSGSLSASSTIDTGTISLTINGNSTNITIGSSNNTLQDLVDEINAITGMQATLVDQTGSGGLALILRSDTGTSERFFIEQLRWVTRVQHIRVRCEFKPNNTDPNSRGCRLHGGWIIYDALVKFSHRFVWRISAGPDGRDIRCGNDCLIVRNRRCQHADAKLSRQPEHD